MMCLEPLFFRLRFHIACAHVHVHHERMNDVHVMRTSIHACALLAARVRNQVRLRPRRRGRGAGADGGGGIDAWSAGKAGRGQMRQPTLPCVL